jgi:hypothetical protein
VGKFSDKRYFYSEECFGKLLGVMSEKSEAKLQLSEAEQFLQGENRELVRTMLEEFIASGGTGDVGAGVINSRGIYLGQKRIRVRKLKTVLGEIEIHRVGYSNREEESVFPRDAELNLGRSMYSHYLKKKIVAEAARSSFSSASETIKDHFGVMVHTRQVENIVIESSVDFEDFYKDRNSKSTLKAVMNLPILVISLDGKGIVMRKEGLREATRKRSEKTSHHLKHRLSRGEKSNTKRMATVAAVYNIDRFKRMPLDVVGDLNREHTNLERLNRPKPIAKRVWASIDRDSKTVTKEAFSEAKTRDPKEEKEWVILLDGDPRQLRRVKKELKMRKRKATIILDIIHVIEYLWDAARVFYDETNPECESWVKEKLLKLLQGQPGHVAAGIRRSATLKKIRAKNREPIDRTAQYLLKYAPYLKYSEYLKYGYPIATGIIEGACRYLIKDRMDITGARWSLTGAEAIMKLRSLKSSGDLEEYWKYHENREYMRNYGSNYYTLTQN